MRGKVDNCIIFDNSCQINVIFIRGNQDGQPVMKAISIGYKVHPSLDISLDISLQIQCGGGSFSLDIS